VRGRIGYAPGHWLFYATGGFAWTYNQRSLTQIATGNNVTPFLWRLGWAAGAGVEVPIARHWTARLEYLFADYGKTNATYLGTQPVSTDFQLQELRLGLNYQFGNDSAPYSAPIVTKGGPAPEADYLSLPLCAKGGEAAPVAPITPVYHPNGLLLATGFYFGPWGFSASVYKIRKKRSRTDVSIRSVD
jgi:hypothetical protein